MMIAISRLYLPFIVVASYANKIDLKIDEQAIQVFINYSKNVRELLGYINSIKVDYLSLFTNYCKSLQFGSKT